MKQKAENFYSIFPNGTIFKPSLDDLVFSDKSNKFRIHSAIWKFYLQIFPKLKSQSITQNEWISFIQEKRDEFAKIKKQYLVTPNFDAEHGYDSLGPLSSNPNSEWGQYFKDNQLKAVIAKDTTRLFQEINFFNVPNNIERINEITFLHLRAFPEIEYQQGFHEICGFVFYVLKHEMKYGSEEEPNESKNNDENEKSETENDGNPSSPETTNSKTIMLDSNSDDHEFGFKFMFSKDFVDADTFWLYTELINYLLPFYQHSDELNQSILPYDITRCNEVLHFYVKMYKPEIAPFLLHSSIPFLMTKWFRLLFLRLFDFQYLTKIWTPILAFFPDTKLLSYISLEIILTMEEDILTYSDPNITLSLISKFQGGDPEVIIKEAIKKMNSRSNLNSVSAQDQNSIQNTSTVQTYLQRSRTLLDPVCKEVEQVLRNVCVITKDELITKLQKFRDSLITVATDNNELFENLHSSLHTSQSTGSMGLGSSAEIEESVLTGQESSLHQEISLPKASSGQKTDTSILTEEIEEVTPKKHDLFNLLPSKPLFE
ncbi:hypothetical protein TRFO_05812 [Tritrichomonas foetus]|uniref:Rab-GAP TBC domain-containing protein n=1 Tax=Tritrichomonas foetus TaxID=1144522 RepID=A0A1J4K2L9_9EUKA|nr:hypothetical protein TRFO_05812 [Tritrichomonas foetus]|eukprot:OHT05681.1 hypothetical protein TRFO_05812 [Tritrichomonas foetus]